MEYHCRQTNGAPQGTAVAAAEAWDNKEKALLAVKHEVASDEYYAWYLENQCLDGTVLHFCGGRPGQCRTKLELGDKRELIHVSKWRCLTPSLCLRQSYTRDLGVLMGREALGSALAATRKAEERTPLKGTGLDAAVRDNDLPEEAERGRDLQRRKDKASPTMDRRRRKSVVEVMQERAQSRASSEKEEDLRRKKKKHTKRSRSRRRKMKNLADTSSSMWSRARAVIRIFTRPRPGEASSRDWRKRNPGGWLSSA